MARYLSIEEKLALLRRIEAGERLAAVAEETGAFASRFTNGARLLARTGRGGLNRKRGPKPGGRAAVDPPSADAGPPATRPPDELTKAKRRIAELERLAGRQQVDLDFFREALRSWDDKRRGSGAPISSRSSKK